MKKKNVSTAVKSMKVKKLTPADLMKITGGCSRPPECRDGGQDVSCIAFIIKDPI